MAAFVDDDPQVHGQTLMGGENGINDTDMQVNHNPDAEGSEAIPPPAAFGAPGLGSAVAANGANDRPSMEESMANFFECALCFDTAEDAVETNCCHRIYCFGCSQQIEKEYKNCPICKKVNVKFSISHPIRRMIGSMPAQCPNKCNMRITRSSLKEHLIKYCPNKKNPCTVKGCKFEYPLGNKISYCNHISQTHHTIMLQSFDYYNKNVIDNDGKDNNDNNNNNEKKGNEDESKMGAMIGPNGNNINDRRRFMDPRMSQRNERGNIAKLGSSGKFYCGKRSGITCNCCDGNCGPTNGHNCIACMRLDLKMRGLLPKNVNNQNGNANSNQQNQNKNQNKNSWMRLFGNNDNGNNGNNGNKRNEIRDKYLINTDGHTAKLEKWRDRVKVKVKRQNVGFGMNLFFDSGDDNDNNNSNDNDKNDTQFKYEIRDKENFYCGRYCKGSLQLRGILGAAYNDAGWDGYCGPNNGPNCPSCRELDITYQNGSYRNVWN